MKISFSDADMWGSYETYMNHLHKHTNFYASFQLLLEYVKREGLTPKLVADIGAGYGWTSELLVNHFNDTSVYAIDPVIKFSKTSLSDQGRLLSIEHNQESSVIREVGSFSDFIIRDYDLIITTAAIHHAIDLSLTLKRFYDALMPGGYLIISNELFLSEIRFYYSYFKKIIKLCYHTISKNYSDNDQFLAQGRFKYDAKHGDWFIQKKYLLKLCEREGFQLVDEINTGVYPYKSLANGNVAKLTHLVFRRY